MNDSIRLTLVKLLQGLIIDRSISYEDRMKYVFFVSIEDTSLMEQQLMERKEFDGNLCAEFTVKGINGALPLFYGHIVIWNVLGKTELRHFRDMSKENLLLVVEKQKQQIQMLHEHRQRL